MDCVLVFVFFPRIFLEIFVIIFFCSNHFCSNFLYGGGIFLEKLFLETFLGGKLFSCTFCSWKYLGEIFVREICVGNFNKLEDKHPIRRFLLENGWPVGWLFLGHKRAFWALDQT